MIPDTPPQRELQARRCTRKAFSTQNAHWLTNGGHKDPHTRRHRVKRDRLWFKGSRNKTTLTPDLMGGEFCSHPLVYGWCMPVCHAVAYKWLDLPQATHGILCPSFSGSPLTCVQPYFLQQMRQNSYDFNSPRVKCIKDEHSAEMCTLRPDGDRYTQSRAESNNAEVEEAMALAGSQGSGLGLTG